MLTALTQFERDALTLGSLAALWIFVLFIGPRIGAALGRRLGHVPATRPASRVREGNAGPVPAAGVPRPSHGPIVCEVVDGSTVVHRRPRPYDWADLPTAGPLAREDAKIMRRVEAQPPLDHQQVTRLIEMIEGRR